MGNILTRNDEIKQTLDKQHFLSTLKQWVECLENNEDFELTLNNKQYTIPTEAVDLAHKLQVEYELDDGEFELEFTMKWYPEKRQGTVDRSEEEYE